VPLQRMKTPSTARPDHGTWSVLARGLAFPEGPAFDPFGNLWCVEMAAGMLWRRTAAGEVSRQFVDGRPNGIAIDAGGRIWFCDSGLNAIRRLDPALGEVVTVVETVAGRRLDKPNDLALDGAGNLVFSCPGESRAEPTGYVCCLAPDGSVGVIADGLYFPNGLAFTRDDGDLIIAETRRQRLWSGGWDRRARRWIDPRVLASTAGQIGPDGICVARDGSLYVAVHGSNRIEIKSATGEPFGCLSAGQGNPTNCAFDPSGLLGLVVTEVTDGSILSYPDIGPGLALAAPSTALLGQEPI
jgi:gluconolactonase